MFLVPYTGLNYYATPHTQPTQSQFQFLNLKINVDMNEDVIIETERLILRQYRLDDVNDIVEGLNNLSVTKWLAGAPYPYTEQDALHFINKLIDNNLYNFAIVLKSENKVIGGTQLTNIDFHNGTAGGGIWIN